MTSLSYCDYVIMSHLNYDRPAHLGSLRPEVAETRGFPVVGTEPQFEFVTFEVGEFVELIDGVDERLGEDGEVGQVGAIATAQDRSADVDLGVVRACRTRREGERQEEGRGRGE